MKYKDGSEELYDMRIDSKQFQNLVEKPEYLGQLTSIRQMYENERNPSGSSSIFKENIFTSTLALP